MKLKIGLAGHGAIARHCLVPAMHACRYAELAGVCGRDAERCRRFAGEAGIPAWYADYEEMLADGEIDGVLLATPNYLHYPQVIAAAEAGKHVLCEKPMALNMKEALQMVDACESAGVVFMVGHHLRYKSCNIRAAEMVKNGDLGRVSTALAKWSFNIPGGRLEDAWRNKPELSGGGQLMNVNAHCLDLLAYLFGKAVKVSAFLQRENDAEVEEGSTVIAEFTGGITAIARGSYREHGVSNSLEIAGSASSLLVEGACSAGRHGTLRLMPSGDVEKAEFDESPYAVEVDHFARAVSENFEPASSGRRTLDTMELIMAAYLSAETGEHIDLQNR